MQKTQQAMTRFYRRLGLVRRTSNNRTNAIHNAGLNFAFSTFHLHSILLRYYY
jgi:hypothetical protein